MFNFREKLITCVILIICVGKRIAIKKSVSIIFGGDVSFGSVLRYTVENGNCTYNESFAKIKDYLHANFVVVNHEMVYQNFENMIHKQTYSHTHLIADPAAIPALKYAGIQIVSLANNHITDLREEGVNYTTQLLRDNNIQYVGITYGKTHARQKPIILEKNGVKIGMLSYCALDFCLHARRGVNVGQAIYDPVLVLSEIRNLRKVGCSVVILFMHWDEEYTSVMDIMVIKKIKHILHSEPVELIVGAHPHTTHYHFYINNTLVASSLGNFLFHSHYAGSLNFNKADHSFAPSMLRKYIGLWAKMSRLLKNPTAYGRLLKVEFDRNGVVPKKTTYLQTQVFPSEGRDCLVVDKKVNTTWQVVCGDGDPECMGTRRCNIMECDGYETFPELSTPA